MEYFCISVVFGSQLVSRWLNLISPYSLISLISLHGSPFLSHSHLEAFSVALVLLCLSPSLSGILKVLVRERAARPLHLTSGRHLAVQPAGVPGELPLTGGGSFLA